jgi:hypothetical protein
MKFPAQLPSGQTLSAPDVAIWPKHLSIAVSTWSQ